MYYANYKYNKKSSHVLNEQVSWLYNYTSISFALPIIWKKS